MEEVKVQRYVCKICNKICFNGKSLGGHMRGHLALISASKKAEKSVVVSKKTDSEGVEDSIRQSNSSYADGVTADGDQNNSYDLRENPRKSWRTFDSKRGPSKKGTSCKVCGKGFPSSRALSGHMRLHSAKKCQGPSDCKQCGKGFDSMRALFGHMKCHAKRSRPSEESAAESLSDLENLCPIRKKRSKIRYNKFTPNTSFSGLNPSSSSVCEIDGVEEAAAHCLMMLSRGEKNHKHGFNSISESSDNNNDNDDDDSVFSEADSYYLNNGFNGKGKAEPIGEIDSCISGSANAFSEHNAVEFELGSGVVGGIEKNVKMEVSVDDWRDFDSTKSALSSDNPEILHKAICDNSSVDIGTRVVASGADVGGIIMGSELSKGKQHECPTCFKVFSSGQALGGHRRAHYTVSTKGRTKEETMALDQDIHRLVDECPDGDNNVELKLWWADEGGHEHDKLVDLK